MHALHDLGAIQFVAGRVSPGNREAVGIQFPADNMVPNLQLPTGQGFEVQRVKDESGRYDNSLITLAKSAEGSLDIFAMMAVDVLRRVEHAAQNSSASALPAFIKRVGDWQKFMAADRRKPLSLEKQAGLMGELVFLESLSHAVGGLARAIGMWEGPFRAAQDFQVGLGAVEVKSTAATAGFKAKINSIEQLDCDRSPLFLATIQFSDKDSGEALPSLVSRLKERARAGGAIRSLEACLFASRYFEEHEALYQRCLAVEEIRCFNVEEPGFPRLARTKLPNQITKVVYDLDVDSIETAGLSLDKMMAQLGTIDQ